MEIKNIKEFILDIPIPDAINSPNKTEFYNGAKIMKDIILKKFIEDALEIFKRKKCDFCTSHACSVGYECDEYKELEKTLTGDSN